MSKKRFSAGLDDLFSDNYAASMTELGGLDTAANPTAPTERKASAHKNFLSDLDSLLQEVLEESIEKFEANQPDSVTASSSKSKGNARVPAREQHSGLDALIRQTIDVQEIMMDETNGKKRLTVSVDRTKLDKLKTIARLENAYLKDLVAGVIDGYIEEYVQQRGIKI